MAEAKLDASIICCDLSIGRDVVARRLSGNLAVAINTENTGYYTYVFRRKYGDVRRLHCV